MTHKSSINFKVILFYFKQKDTIKVLPILTLSSALVKICQVSHVIFSNHKPFFPQNLHNSSESWKITPLYFCSSNIYTLATRSQLKHRFFSFQVLGSKFVKFLKKVLKWKVNSSSIFVSFFTVMTHNSSVKLKLKHFLLWTKESLQSSNFDTSSALVKICQIPHVIFQATSQFFFKFCITLQCHER